jgi:AraC-like DNA-binding protein
MISNLNKLTFKRYGEVLNDRQKDRGFPEGDEWEDEVLTFNSAQSELTCLPDSDIYMDFDTGMSVLMVAAADNPQKIDYFYLDKPLRIAKGNYFAIIPYFETCSVRQKRLKGAEEKKIPISSKGQYTISPKLELKDIYTLFYQEKEKGFLFKGEAHKQYELTYVDSGQMHSVVNGYDYILEQGEMMIYDSNQWHMQFADEDRTVSFITITFDMECEFISSMINRKRSVEPQAAQLLKRILEEAERQDFLSDDMVLCYLKEFLLLMLRGICNKHPDMKPESTIKANNENEIIEKAQRYIAEHIYDKLTVGVVAKQVNVSVAYFSTLFKKHIHMSPSEYISRLKLEKSKALIKEGKLNFTQIANELNFSTIHHFSRRFKNQYGVTPTEYSKSLR